MDTKRILVIAAHPDDEILGAGGAMAKHVANKDQVVVLILGEGVTSRKGDERAEDKVTALGEQSKSANDIIGVSSIHYANFPDNKFDTVPLLSIAQTIEAIAEEFKPNIIFTHHHGDVNVDHRLTSDAAQSAFRPMQGSTVEAIYAFEIASSSEWNFRHGSAFRPNVYLDISGESLNKKIAAMEAYATEIREFPHPRSSKYLRALATVRGGQVGIMEAEAFELVYKKGL